MTQDTPPYTQEISAVFKKQAGFSPQIHEALVKDAVDAAKSLRDRYESGDLPLLHLSEETEDLPELETLAANWRQRLTRVLVVGIGGSSAGGRTLCALKPQSQVRIDFLDGLCPDELAAFERLSDQDWQKTGLIIISKSGETAEVLAQAAILLEQMPKDRYKTNCLIITEPKQNSLAALANHYGIKTISHDPNIGGRYSVLSAVGLLPALLAGVGIRAVREGAATVLTQTLEIATNPSRSAPSRPETTPAPISGAAIMVQALRDQQLPLHILMPYIKRLEAFNLWHRQLWAESIGKPMQGDISCSTPVTALGPTDQHSQLQLYLDGPKDKLFTLITQDTAQDTTQAGLTIRKDIRQLAPSTDYLNGKTIGDLLAAQQIATTRVLLECGHPLRLFHISKLDERSLGALLMHFMLETILVADLLGINAFDQPAVEQGKQLTRQLLRDNKTLNVKDIFEEAATILEAASNSFNRLKQAL